VNNVGCTVIGLMTGTGRRTAGGVMEIRDDTKNRDKK
jgi:hypothetical protein